MVWSISEAESFCLIYFKLAADELRNLLQRIIRGIVNNSLFCCCFWWLFCCKLLCFFSEQILGVDRSVALNSLGCYCLLFGMVKEDKVHFHLPPFPSPLLALPSVICYHYYIFVFFFSGKFVKSVPMKLVKEVQQCFFVFFLPSFFPSVCGFVSLFLSLSVWLSLSHSLSQMLQPESSIESRIMKSLLQMPFQLHISKSRVFVSALERHTHW